MNRQIRFQGPASMMSPNCVFYVAVTMKAEGHQPSPEPIRLHLTNLDTTSTNYIQALPESLWVVRLLSDVAMV